MNLLSRAQGCLWGLAIGDALGMPTQDLPPDIICADYGHIHSLLPAGSRQVIAEGAPAGMITDDTEQALVLARLLAADGRVDPRALTDALLTWENDMIARGSLDLLGPSTKRALLAIREGASPADAGRTGTTNGAAMRVAPVGIVVPSEPMGELVDAVVAASRPTHGTSVALAGAAAVAGVVSAALDGADLAAALEFGLAAAAEAAAQGTHFTAPDIALRTRWAIDQLRRAPDPITALFHLIGTSMQSHESVVAALAITALDIPDWEAVCLAASAGGDTDTVGAMVGAMRGALSGMETWPADVVNQIAERNSLSFDTLAPALLERRARAAGKDAP